MYGLEIGLGLDLVHALLVMLFSVINIGGQKYNLGECVHTMPYTGQCSDELIITTAHLVSCKIAASGICHYATFQ